MKKHGTLILMLLSLVFSAFCMGFFLGRNFTQAPIVVSALPVSVAQPTAAGAAQTTACPAQPSETAQPAATGTQPITEPVTQDTMLAVLDAASEPSTEAAPEPSTEAAAEPSTEAAPEPSTETATESSTEVATEPSAPTTAAPTESNGLININTAGKASLMTLPGIGETLSQRIIDYREANGPFRSVSELLKVSGIGEKRLAAILDYICVGG